MRKLPREEALEVFHRGRLIARPHVTLRFLKGGDGPRFVTVVGARVAPLAVERNAVRRRLRAALREALMQAPVSVSGAVVATERTAEASTRELTEELIAMFHTLS